MEPKDEFEFKPINEGLGFHKKAVELKETVSDAGFVEDSVSKRIPKARRTEDLFKRDKDIFASVNDPAIRFYDETDRNTFDAAKELIRKSERAEIETTAPKLSEASTTLSPSPASASAIATAAPAASVADAPSIEPRLERKTSAPVEKDLGLASPGIGPMILDLFVSIGLVSMFAVPLLLITNVDPVYILSRATTDIATQLSIGILYLSVLSFYLVISRSFLGSTLGEWAFDLAVGKKEQRDLATYPIRIAWRCLLMFATGIILLPIAGLIMGRDILGQLSGVCLRHTN